MELTREEDRKLQRAILHTAGKYTQEDLSEYSEEDKKIIEGYMAAWDGVHVTVSNFVQGEYSVVGWPPEEDEKAKDDCAKITKDLQEGNLEYIEYWKVICEVSGNDIKETNVFL